MGCYKDLSIFATLQKCEIDISHTNSLFWFFKLMYVKVSRVHQCEESKYFQQLRSLLIGVLNDQFQVRSQVVKSKQRKSECNLSIPFVSVIVLVTPVLNTARSGFNIL